MTLSASKTTVGFSAIIIIIVASFGAFALSAQSTLANGNKSLANGNKSASASTVVAPQSTSTSSAYNFTKYGLMYLSPDPGCATQTGSGPWYPSPCWAPQSDAFVFNCAADAATLQGCTQRVYIKGSANQSFVVTVWYPYINSTSGLPWENCKFAEILPSNNGVRGYAFCPYVNSSSFLVALPGPTPP